MSQLTVPPEAMITCVHPGEWKACLLKCLLFLCAAKMPFQRSSEPKYISSWDGPSCFFKKIQILTVAAAGLSCYLKMSGEISLIVLFLPIRNALWPRWRSPAGWVSCCTFSFSLCNSRGEVSSWKMVVGSTTFRKSSGFDGLGYFDERFFFLIFEWLRFHILLCETNLRKIAATTGVKEVTLLHENREKVWKVVLCSKGLVS